MEIRRILMTTDTIGGVWTYALELAEALEPYGIEIALATMGDLPDRAQRRQAGAVSNVLLHESRFKLEWMENPWREVETAGKWLLLLERRLRPDLVHLNGVAHGALPWTAPVLIVAHSCVYSWFHFVKGKAPSEADWNDYRLNITRGLRAADAVTAPSRAMLDILKKTYGEFASCDPIYNGRNCALFKPSPKKNFILAAGRLWDEAKNISLLAQVAPDLPWPVLVAGDTRHPSGERVRMEGIQLLGKLPASELCTHFAHASIFVLPARYEPFGLCALEAAMAECALVLGDIPFLREIWGDAALFVPPDSPEFLKELLLDLIADNGMLKKVAKRCRERARYYTPRRMAAGYVDLYGRMIAGQGYPLETQIPDRRMPV